MLGIKAGIGLLTKAVNRPKAEGYNIRVGSQWFRTVAGPESLLQIGTRDSLADRLDQDGSIYNNVLDIGYAWGRTDLSGGEGLDWDPREIALDTKEASLDLIRFWDSDAIDTRRPDRAGQQYSIRLGRSSESWAGTVTDPKDMATSDQFIYIADGAVVSWYSGWYELPAVGLDTLPSPVVALAASPNDAVMAVCEDGNVYAKRPTELVFTLAYTSSVGPTPWAFTGNWDYDTPPNPTDPPSGEIQQANSESSVLRVSKIDNDAGDRSFEIAGLKAGDSIEKVLSSGDVWTIQYVIDNGTWFAIGVQPTTQFPPDGVVEFGFITQRLPARGVWYVNGRFVISTWDTVNTDTGELRTIEWVNGAWNADLNVIDTANGQFWSVVESGPAVVAACGDGTVRTYTPDNSNGGSYLLEPRARTTMPEGETPLILGANLGVLLILTATDRVEADRQELRMYQAEVLDARFDYSVGQLQLKREWLGAEHEPLTTRNMTNTRDEIYWFIKEERNGVLYESLWRMDLVTGGFNRVSSEQNIDLNGLVIFEDINGGIDFANADIIIGDPSKHENFGYVIFPNITFGLNTEISWLSTVLEAHDLQNTGAQVELYRSTKPQAILDPFDSSWVLVQRLSSQGASNLEVPFSSLKSRTLSLQLRLASTDSQSVSPKVTRIALRGIPAHRDFVMMVPFNISDYVSVPGRTPSRVPGLGNSLHNEVLDLVGQSVQAVMIDPPIVFEGIVNNVSEPVEFLAERGSVTRYVMVEFRGTRSTSVSINATGDDGMGLGLMGIATVGIGQTEQE